MLAVPSFRLSLWLTICPEPALHIGRRSAEAASTAASRGANWSDRTSDFELSEEKENASYWNSLGSTMPLDRGRGGLTNRAGEALQQEGEIYLSLPWKGTIVFSDPILNVKKGSTKETSRTRKRTR